jgi:hypothetical protein
MARAKLTALAVEQAHRAGEPVLLGDGAGLYLRVNGGLKARHSGDGTRI